MDPSSHNHNARPSLEPSNPPPGVNPASRRSLLDRLSISHPQAKPSEDGGAELRPSPPMQPMSFDTFQFSSLTTKGVPSLLQRMFHSGHPSLHSPADPRAKETAPRLNNSALQDILAVPVLNKDLKASQSINTDAGLSFPSGSEDMIMESSSQLPFMMAPEISSSSSTAHPPPPEIFSPAQPNSFSLQPVSVPPQTAAEMHLPQQDVQTPLAPAPLLSPFSLISPATLPHTPTSAPSYTHEHAFLRNLFPPAFPPLIGSVSLAKNDKVDPLISPPTSALPQARSLSYLDALYAEVQQEQTEWSQLAELKKQKVDISGAMDRQDSAVEGSSASMMASPRRGPSSHVVGSSTTIPGSGGSSSPNFAQVVQSIHTGVGPLDHDHFETPLASRINATSSRASVPPSNHSSPLATSQPSHESWRDKSARSLLRHPAVPQWIHELESTDSKHLAHAPVQALEDRPTTLPTPSIRPISLKRRQESAFENDNVVKTEAMDEDDALRSPSKRPKRERSSGSLVAINSIQLPGSPDLGQPIPSSSNIAKGSPSDLSTDDVSHSNALSQPSRVFPTPPDYLRHQFPPSPEGQPHTDAPISDAQPASYSSLGTLQQARSSVVHIAPGEAKTETRSLADHKAPIYSNQLAVRGPHNMRPHIASVSEPLEAPVLNHEDCLDDVSAYSRPLQKDPSEEQGRGFSEQDLGPTTMKRSESPFVQNSPPITLQLCYPISDDARTLQASVHPSPVSSKPKSGIASPDLRAEDLPVRKESTTPAPPSSSETDPYGPTSDPEQDSGLGGPDDYADDSVESPGSDKNSASHFDTELPSTSSVERMQTDTPPEPSPESSEQRVSRSLNRTPGESPSRIPSGVQSPDPFQTVYSAHPRRNHDVWLPEPSPPHHRLRPYSPRRDRTIPYAQRRSRSPSPRPRPRNHSPNRHHRRRAPSYIPRHRRSLSPVPTVGDISRALDRPSSPVWNERKRLHTRKGQTYISDSARGSAWRPPAPLSKSLSPLTSPGGRRYELLSRSPTPPGGRPFRRRHPSSGVLEADHTDNASAKPSTDLAPIPVAPMHPPKPSPSVSPVTRKAAAVRLVRPVPLPPPPSKLSLTAPPGHDEEITNSASKTDSTSLESYVKQPRMVNYSSGSLLSASEQAITPERPPQHPGTTYLGSPSNPPDPERVRTLSDKLTTRINWSAPGDSRLAEEVFFADRLDTPVSQALSLVEGPKPSLLSRMNPKIEVPPISQDDDHQGNSPRLMSATYDTFPTSSVPLLSRVGGSPPKQRVNPLASLYDIHRGNYIQDQKTPSTESSLPVPTGFSDPVHQTSSHRGGSRSGPRGRSRRRGRRFGYDGV